MLLTSDPSGFDVTKDFDSSDVGFKQRRGIYPALLGMDAPDSTSSANGAPTSSSGSRLVDRISDDPQIRHASIDDATNDLESRVSTTAAPHYRPVAPDEHIQQLENQYQQYSTPQQQPKRPLWQKIGLGLLAAAGGGAGLARGEQIRNQRFDTQQAQRQQRAESLMQQIEAERRMHEQEDIEGQRFDLQQRMQSERERAAQQSQERLFGQQQQIENQRETLRQQMQADAQRQQQAHQDAQFQHSDESQNRLFAQQNALEDKRENFRQQQEQQKNQETQIQPAKAALEYASNYVTNKQYTGPGDEALMEKFFELARPEKGFRMTEPQLNMLKNAQSWQGGLVARIRHATTGTWFSDAQRQQILGTMTELAQAKGVGGQAGGTARDLGPAPQGKAEGSTGRLPDGTRVTVRNGRIVAQ